MLGLVFLTILRVCVPVFDDDMMAASDAGEYFDAGRHAGYLFATGVGAIASIATGGVALGRASLSLTSKFGGTLTKLGRGVEVRDVPSNLDNSTPTRIYSARELLRRVEEPGPFHNFPESFNADIFKNGTRTVINDDYIEYVLPGEIVLPGKPPISDNKCDIHGKV